MPSSIVYLHGFLSSPLSFKAQQVKLWLEEHHPDIQYFCPMLPPYPEQAYRIIEQQLEALDGPIYLMGSSLGGFWATVFAERFKLPAVLINPAVELTKLITRFENQTLKNYHTDDTYWLTPEHSQQLLAHQTQSMTPAHYWLLLQTGDETLDYQLAKNHYVGAKQTIEEGGDHSFQGFERFLPEVIEFFEAAP